MSLGHCPRCDSGSTINGLIPGARGGGPYCFIPAGCRSSWGPIGVRFREAPSFACLSCGLVWTELRPDELRSHIVKYGNAGAKDRLPKRDALGVDGELA